LAPLADDAPALSNHSEDCITLHIEFIDLIIGQFPFIAQKTATVIRRGF